MGIGDLDGTHAERREAVAVVVLSRQVWDERQVATLGPSCGGLPSRARQLRQGFSEEQVLDFVYGLDYLAPVYSLTWDGRTVDELSTG